MASVILLFVVFVFDLIAFGLAVAAEQRRTTFYSSRVFFFIAEVCLLAGSVQNAYHTKYRVYLGNTAPSCRSLRKGVFGAGAAFIVLTGIVSELYYVCLTRAKDFEAPRDPGIRMSSL